MSHSRFEYVKKFELSDVLLPDVWIVVRIDGRGFSRQVEEGRATQASTTELRKKKNRIGASRLTCLLRRLQWRLFSAFSPLNIQHENYDSRLTTLHNFQKPNDQRALDLMNASAVEVLTEFEDIVFAIGQSDEFSFVFQKTTRLFQRRSSKLLSLLVSTFSAAYVRLWSSFIHEELQILVCVSIPAPPLQPSFDGRIVCYPTDRHLRDYISWRQADTHINNLYNTCFWALVKAGSSRTEAQAELKGTSSSDKNEMLFTRFHINYNDLPAQFRKGSILFRSASPSPAEPASGRAEVAEDREKSPMARTTERCTEVMRSQQRHRSAPSASTIVRSHEDVIRDGFWLRHPHILR